MTAPQPITLSQAEIVALTGYRRPSAQIRQLRAYGLRFFVAADGHPRVLRADLDPKAAPRAVGPDYTALAL